MTSQPLGIRVRESAKLGVRKHLARADLAISRDPFASRLTRALRSAHINQVLDIGANVGQYARMLRDCGYAGRIVSVEPLVDAYHHLQRRSEGDQLWTTLNAAVGAQPGSAQINVSANSYSSSLLSMTAAHVKADPRSAVIGTQHVDVVTVVDVVDACGLTPRRCLLKIDTQGFEQQVLDGAGDLVRQFAAVQVELSLVELYRGQRLFGDMVEFLHGHGFTLWSLETGISDEDGRLLQADGLFIRTDG